MPTTVRCPTCRTPAPWADNPFRPFCSERCRTVDLGNWASDRYRVPGPPADPTELPEDAAGDDDPR